MKKEYEVTFKFKKENDNINMTFSTNPTDYINSEGGHQVIADVLASCITILKEQYSKGQLKQAINELVDAAYKAR